MSARRITLAAVLATVCLGGFGVPGAFAQAEPNDTPATASGPIAADAPYAGTIETANDVDYYSLYVDDTRQLTISFQNTTPGRLTGCPYCELDLRLANEQGSELIGTSAAFGQPASVVAYTVQRGRYYIAIQPDDSRMTGASYSFTVSAPGGLVSAECFTAQDNVARYGAEVSAAKKRLAKTRNRARRARVKKTIKSVGGALSAAQQQVTATCPA